MRRRRCRGFALLSTVLALTVAAVVLDRIAEAVARDRARAEGTAAFEVVRAIAEAAWVLDAEPLAQGALPHVRTPRDMTVTYTAVPGGTDTLALDWSGMAPRTEVALGNRVGEWLGIDRVTPPLVLGLDDIPPPYPLRVERRAPAMQTDLESAGIRSAGALEAAAGDWAAAGAGDVTVTPTGPGDEGGAVFRAAIVNGTVDADRLAVRKPMGVPDPVTLIVTNPPPGQAALRVGTLTATTTLSVPGRIVPAVTTVTGAATADALVPEDGVVQPLLPGAQWGDVTLDSVRARSTSTGRLTVGNCIGCTP
ncbi:MAG: hypothetical protein OXI46_11255 [Gemmatimonadota bacterium]|nr:hypothetical protein [Gemmatimonadota bacterium]